MTAYPILPLPITRSVLFAGTKRCSTETPSFRLPSGPSHCPKLLIAPGKPLILLLRLPDCKQKFDFADKPNTSHQIKQELHPIEIRQEAEMSQFLVIEDQPPVS